MTRVQIPIGDEILIASVDEQGGRRPRRRVIIHTDLSDARKADLSSAAGIQRLESALGRVPPIVEVTFDSKSV